MSSKLFQANLYVDCGNGFNEQDKLSVVYEHNKTNKVTFDLSDFDNILNLRFDPIEGVLIKCKLNNINFRQVNSSHVENNFYIFNNFDPWFILGSFDEKILTIEFEMEVLKQLPLEEWDNLPNVNCQANLYVDCGRGFNEHDKISVEYFPEKYNKLHFNLSDFDNILNLRFDPIEGYLIKCKLHNDFKDNNSVFVENDYYFFNHEDPWFVLTDLNKNFSIEFEMELITKNDISNLYLRDIYSFKYYSQIENNSSKQKVGIFCITGDASSHIRLLNPLNILNNEENEYEFFIFNLSDIIKFKNDLLNDVMLLDIIIIQRQGLDERVSKLLFKKCKQYGVKVIFDIDDDLVNIDKSHIDYNYFSIIREHIIYIIKNSDLIVVSTDYLKEKIAPYNSKIITLKNNLIDEWDFKDSIKKNKSDNLIKIGYMGSLTHKNDLIMIKNAILDVKNYTDKNIIFEVIGVTYDKLDWINQINIPFDKKLYPFFVKWLKKIVDWDIALAPLEDTSINRSKSELKYLEYTALNVPGIYSSIEPYQKNIIQGETGLLVTENTSEAWKLSILKLVEDENLRKNILLNAKIDINNNYLINNAVNEWRDILDKNKRIFPNNGAEINSSNNSRLINKLKKFFNK